MVFGGWLARNLFLFRKDNRRYGVKYGNARDHFHEVSADRLSAQLPAQLSIEIDQREISDSQLIRLRVEKDGAGNIRCVNDRGRAEVDAEQGVTVHDFHAAKIEAVIEEKPLVGEVRKLGHRDR